MRTIIPTVITRTSGQRRLCPGRRIAAALMMVAYLLAGVLHGACDLDVTNPTGQGAVTMSAAKDPDAAAKGMVAEHHCHGCFAVAMPLPPRVADRTEPAIAAPSFARPGGAGRAPLLDTPPPNVLT